MSALASSTTSSASPATSPQHDPASLSSRGDTALASAEPSLALSFYTRSLSSLPPSSAPSARAELLEKSAECNLQLGDPSSAASCFKEALSLHPSPQLYQQLGQLSSGEEAASLLSSGISLLSSSPASPESAKHLSLLHVSVAELYMTDLCEHPEAEARAVAAVDAALSLKTSLPDPLQTAASLRLSQSRGGDAVDYILKAYSLMSAAVLTMARLVNLAPDAEPVAPGTVPDEQTDSLPPFEFRTTTAKLLIECGCGVEGVTAEESARLLDAAIAVLGSLLAENDEVVETWFLLGCAMMATQVSSASDLARERSEEDADD